MIEQNLILYGSLARGDNDNDSDVDLLCIDENIENSKTIIGKVNIARYNLIKITSMANEGSLFVYHLKTEGKVIFDNSNIFKKIFNLEFKDKESYIEEISFAFSLMNEIYSNYDKTDNFFFAHSRVVWCLRTIFAGIGAEKKIPLFSKKSIAEYFGYETKNILSLKNQKNKNKLHIKTTIEFIKIILKDRNLLSTISNKSLESFQKSTLKSLLSKEESKNHFFYSN